MRVVVTVLFAGALALCPRYVASATCEQSDIRVSVVAADKQEIIDNKKRIRMAYADKITIYCTGSDSKNLQMSIGSVIEATEIVNFTTRILMIKNPAIRKNNITCTDLGTKCAVEFRLVVFPLFTLSERMMFKNSDNTNMYSIRAGEEYELVCSGNTPLNIYLAGWIDTNGWRDARTSTAVQTITLNTTTIKSIKLNSKESDKGIVYSCYSFEFAFCVLFIEHDYPPVLKEFWCIEIDLQINCTWHVLGTEVTSTLLYMDKYGNSMFLHAYNITSSGNYYGTWRCEWSLENFKQQGLEYHNDMTFVLQACRLSYCANQIYLIDRTSIMKSASPVGLGVGETKPHRAVITWNYNEVYPVEYNITCRQPGLEWAQELKASSQENCDGRNCKIEIKLPCPGVFYELKMYAKLMTTPKETLYWSDPASFTFHAGSQDSTDAVDPVCDEEPESIVNKYVGAQKVKEFKRRFSVNDMKALSGKIQSMNRKLDLIKKLCREQSLGDCEHRSDYVLSAVKMP